MIAVRTVRPDQLLRDCGRLWDLATAQAWPHLVIGIRSGGWWVAEAMNAARSPSGVTFLPLTCRRPSSDVKGRSSAFKFALRVLPYLALDLLRLAEYYLLTLPRCRAVRVRGAAESRIPDATEIDAICGALARLRPDASVLIVDDSLDSGATLQTVVELVRSAAPPGTSVRTALFTVLGPSPIVAADFALYRRVNFRFPWSYDFHG